MNWAVCTPYKLIFNLKWAKVGKGRNRSKRVKKCRKWNIEEEKDDKTGFEGVSRILIGDGRGKLSTRSTYLIYTHGLQSQKNVEWRNKLPFISLDWVKAKWSLSSFVTVELFQRCVVCRFQDFPFNITGYIILQMRGQKTVMFQAFYAFRVFTKERV